MTHSLRCFPLLRANKNDWPHTVVANQEVGKLGEAFQRPTSSRMTCPGKQSDQRRAGVSFRFPQNRIDRSVIVGSCSELWQSRRIANSQRLQHIEITID